LTNVVDAGDANLRAQVEAFDAKVEAVFSGAFEIVAAIEDDQLRDAARDVVQSMAESARLVGRQATYALFNGSDVAATGSALTIQLLRRGRELRRASRTLRPLERGAIKPLDPVPVASDDDLIAQRMREANVAIQGFNASLLEAKRAQRNAARAHALWLTRFVARPVITFQAIRLFAFTLTTALFTKLIAFPFASRGFLGIAIGAALAFLAVQFLLMPMLIKLFVPRLRPEILRLAYAQVAVLRQIATSKVTTAALRRSAATRG
jgi:hypothetical protein